MRYIPAKILLLSAFCTALVFPAGAMAWVEDAEAPSQEVGTDDVAEGYVLSISADALRVAFEEYGLTVDTQITSALSVPADIGWAQDNYLWLESGLRFSPFSEGIGGLWLETTARVEFSTANRMEVGIGGAAEIGYQYIWSGLLIGASAGLGVGYNTATQEVKLVPRFGLELGYAWPL